MFEKQIQTDILRFTIALQNDTNSATNFFSALRLSLLRLFGPNRETLPHPPPSRHYSGHESGIISICARGPGNKKKGKVLIWFFSKLPIRVQSCTRTDPSRQLISLRTQHEKLETDPVEVAAPRFKGQRQGIGSTFRSSRGPCSLFRH
jgi:hypothetical protein